MIVQTKIINCGNFFQTKNVLKFFLSRHNQAKFLKKCRIPTKFSKKLSNEWSFRTHMVPYDYGKDRTVS